MNELERNNSLLYRQAKALEPWLVELRRALHRWPEPSFKEEKTAALLAQQLREIDGVENIRTGVSGHGILAEIAGEQPGPTVALRADMDALNVTEETGLPCTSQNPGMMHACGHDFHMAILTGAAKLLAAHRKELCGKVRLIYQPAEEASPVGGSRGMIDAGALDGVDAVYGLHLWPDVPLGKIGIKSGAFMACSDHFVVELEGASAHAARPETGIDAVVAGSRFVLDAQTIVSRSISPFANAVITIGKMEAGSRYNIIAQHCTLEGTVRTLDPAVRQTIAEGLQKTLDGVKLATGCKGTLRYEYGYMPTVNEAACTDALRRATAAEFGPETVLEIAQPTMIAEDFGFYLAEKPGCFFWLGMGKPQGENYPLHSSHLAPEEGLLSFGAAVVANNVLHFGKA